MDAGGEFLCSRRPVGFRVSFISDALNRSNGQVLSLQAITGAPLGGRGVILFCIGAKYLNRDRTDYYYGVRPAEATLSRPAYSAPATWNIEINVTGIVNFGSRMRLFAKMDRESFGSGIKESPLVDGFASYSFISSLNYIF
jgi:outer membrane protein